MTNRVFIIAEAGVNHNGSISMALELIDLAKKSGADAVKFQTFRANKLATSDAEKAEYQKRATSKKESQLAMLQRLELSKEDHKTLISHCQKRDIEFMSTPFDDESIDLLQRLNIKRFKIPSGELTNLPYLQKTASLNKETILSTGMATLREVEEAITALLKSGLEKEKLTVLHASTAYPTPIADVNLKAMQTIANAFNVKVGYSDHSLGIEVPIAAVAMGAKIIEKHFTISRNLEGPDHKASLEPLELEQMIRSIRKVEKALGDGLKKPSPSELKNIPIARKSIVASKAIREGEKLSSDNITTKRPGKGISPMNWYKLIGSKAKKNYHADELIV